MEKRGQVSIFVVLGFVIFVTVILILLLRNQLPMKKETTIAATLPETVQKVQEYIRSCAEETAIAAIYLIGAQNGYAAKPTISSDQITQDQLRTELGKSIRELLPLCIDFVQFKEASIAAGDIESNVLFQEDSISIGVQYPVEIMLAGNLYQLKEPYKVGLPIRLAKIIEAANLILGKEKQENIDMIALLKTGMDIGVAEEGGKRIYIIADRQSIVKDVPYAFVLEVEA